MHNKLGANKFSRAAQRIAWYLVFGFAMSWIVSWALSWQAQLIAPGRYSFSQLSTAHPRSPKAIGYYLYDRRWIGVWEQQYSVKRSPAQRTSTRVPMQLWWAWEPIHPKGSTTLTFLDLCRQFELIEPDPKEPDPIPHKKTDDEPAVGVGTIELVPGWAFMNYVEIKYGWPAISHQTHRAYNQLDFNSDGSFQSKTTGAIGLPIKSPGTMSNTVVFPYRPIWTGLLVNTIFYACLFWVLLSIKRACRHARRLRQGLCPFCAYDLEFMLRAGCAECGWRKHPSNSSNTPSEMDT